MALGKFLLENRKEISHEFPIVFLASEQLAKINGTLRHPLLPFPCKQM